MSENILPLRGLTIGVTGSRRASELAQLITSFGGKPYIAPTVGIETTQEITKEAETFIKRIDEGVDYAVFMTGPGVYSLLITARNLGLEKRLVEGLRNVTVVARSPKPKNALANHGIKTDIVPEENTAEGIAKVLKNRIMIGRKVAVLWHGSYSPLLKEELGALGAQVFEHSTYTYSFELKDSGAKILEAMSFNYIAPDEAKVVKLIDDIRNGLIDAITFTSPPAARNLFKIASAHNRQESLRLSLNKDIVVVAVGSPTRKAIEENGVLVDVMPEVYKMGPMVKSLAGYVSQANAPKRKIRHQTSPGTDKLGRD